MWYNRNTLPLYRPGHDHKIELEASNDLKYHPLHSQSLPELEATRKYLELDLDKGFITPSSAPFASPILFEKN